MKLDRFIRQHPEAVTTPARGGMTYEAIAARLGVKAATVGKAWRSLSLPDRASLKITPKEKSQRAYQRNRDQVLARTRAWQARHPELVREYQRAANRRYRGKVLRVERCSVCERPFNWKMTHEIRMRNGTSWVVCSSPCGRKAARREQAVTALQPQRRRRDQG